MKSEEENVNAGQKVNKDKGEDKNKSICMWHL